MATTPATEKAAATETQQPAVGPGAADAPSSAEKSYVAEAVVEIVLTRPVEAGADHSSAANQFTADLAAGNADGTTEASRRVKSVRVRSE